MKQSKCLKIMGRKGSQYLSDSIVFWVILLCFTQLLYSSPVEQRVDNSGHTKGGKSHIITCTSQYLMYDSSTISEIIKNSDDGYPDFPDSVWSGYYIEPVYRRVSQVRIKSDSAKFEFQFDSNQVFALVKPVIRAVASANVSKARLWLGNGQNVDLQLYKHRTDKYVVHYGDEDGMYAIVMIKKDSIFIFDNSVHSNPNLVWSRPTAMKTKFLDSELLEFQEAISNLQNRKNGIRWVGIDPHPYTNLTKIYQLFRAVAIVNGGSKDQPINAFLLGVFSPWKRENAIAKKLNKKFCDSLKSLPPYVDIAPTYPRYEIMRGGSAIVEVAITMSRDGNLEKYEILKSGGQRFDEEVVKAIKKTNFRIPCIDDVPKYSFLKLYNFTLGGSIKSDSLTIE